MKYILRKISIFIVTLWVAMTVNFILPRMMPGNPAEALIARSKGRISAQALHSLILGWFPISGAFSAIGPHGRSQNEDV